MNLRFTILDLRCTSPLVKGRTRTKINLKSKIPNLKLTCNVSYTYYS
jgi:hypothetical protein